MRITNQMTLNRMLSNINRNLGVLDRYNTQGATGQKIQAPSDDPIIASRALKFRTIVAENEQYMKNTEQANSWVDITESAVQNIDSIVNKMKELCQRGASDTLNLDDRKKLLTEYNSLVEQLEQEMNTTYMGRYIFSGYKTNKPPIVKNQLGGNVLNTDIYPNRVLGQDITLQIGAGVSMEVNTFAPNLYSEQDYENFHTLGAKVNEIDNLQTEEEKIAFDKQLREDMSAMITTLDTYKAKLATQHTEIGVRSKKIELVQTRLKNDETSYKDLMSKNENADLGEVMMNYNTASAGYQASLRIGMNINQMSLADYLR